MTDIQLYTVIAVAVPLVVNGICFTAVFMMLSWLKDRINRLEDTILKEFKELKQERRLIR